MSQIERICPCWLRTTPDTSSERGSHQSLRNLALVTTPKIFITVDRCVHVSCVFPYFRCTYPSDVRALQEVKRKEGLRMRVKSRLGGIKVPRKIGRIDSRAQNKSRLSLWRSSAIVKKGSDTLGRSERTRRCHEAS